MIDPVDTGSSQGFEILVRVVESLIHSYTSEGTGFIG